MFEKNSKKTLLQFKKEGYSRSTIKIQIKMYGESDNINFKASSERHPVIATFKMLKKVKKIFVQHLTITVSTD